MRIWTVVTRLDHETSAPVYVSSFSTRAGAEDEFSRVAKLVGSPLWILDPRTGMVTLDEVVAATGDKGFYIGEEEISQIMDARADEVDGSDDPILGGLRFALSLELSLVESTLDGAV